MYVKVYFPGGSATVKEMTPKQMRQAQRLNPQRTFLPITGQEAHNWVRNGGVHSTPLYVNEDGRIRYAKDMS
jgi:hypothetical protein